MGVKRVPHWEEIYCVNEVSLVCNNLVFPGPCLGSAQPHPKTNKLTWHIWPSTANGHETPPLHTHDSFINAGFITAIIAWSSDRPGKSRGWKDEQVGSSLLWTLFDPGFFWFADGDSCLIWQTSPHHELLISCGRWGSTLSHNSPSSPPFPFCLCSSQKVSFHRNRHWHNLILSPQAGLSAACCFFIFAGPPGFVAAFGFIWGAAVCHSC